MPLTLIVDEAKTEHYNYFLLIYSTNLQYIPYEMSTTVRFYLSYMTV